MNVAAGVRQRWQSEQPLVDQIAELLGRPPAGGFEVAIKSGLRPLVIHNAPFLWNGTPMPTSYWLVDGALLREVSRLESAGGVREAEAAVDPQQLAASHSACRRARELDAVTFRDAYPDVMPLGLPSGGVGGTRQGVKCLHAHLAWHLVSGIDPVGAWVIGKVGELGPLQSASAGEGGQQ